MRNIKVEMMFLPCLIFIGNVFSSSVPVTRTKRWNNEDMTDDKSNMFRGEAGIDYPDLKTIPNTSFRCEDKIYEGGLYADTETRCQVYHVCHDGRKDSFLCGRGTIFNQQILACDYWYSAECENAQDYYHLNSQIGVYSPNNLPNDYMNNVNKHHDARNVDSTGNNRENANGDQNICKYKGHHEQPCQCLRNSKTPWSFPIGNHGTK